MKRKKRNNKRNSRVNSERNVELLGRGDYFARVEADGKPDVVVTCQRVAHGTQHCTVTG